ncbi:hypothetical protein AAVH_19695 [Aphelenchoides avenae]|nr:hypothetical protein AAVH_19695 [Aphelenchus avenae]
MGRSLLVLLYVAVVGLSLAEARATIRGRLKCKNGNALGNGNVELWDNSRKLGSVLYTAQGEFELGVSDRDSAVSREQWHLKAFYHCGHPLQRTHQVDMYSSNNGVVELGTIDVHW